MYVCMVEKMVEWVNRAGIEGNLTERMVAMIGGLIY